jgi:inner membrane protein
MSPITHLLAGWTALEKTQFTNRDRALVVFAGLAPDLDGLGIVVDFATRMLGMPETDYYQSYHRIYGHGLGAALLFSVLVGFVGIRKIRAALGAFAAIHLHFLCDVMGSRGSTPEDIWPIYYLAPFSDALTLSWSDQWPLVGWQNMVLTMALLAIAAARAVGTGYSPVGLFSRRGDIAFVATLRARWQKLSSRK